MSFQAEVQLAHLRHRRREMRRELARIRWWLRLLQAKKDLVIAQAAFPGETGAIDLDAAWEALAAAIWTDADEGIAGSIERIDALVARLTQYEARVSENLETVTGDVVKAMGEAHRASVAPKVSHG